MFFPKSVVDRKIVPSIGGSLLIHLAMLSSIYAVQAQNKIIPLPLIVDFDVRPAVKKKPPKKPARNVKKMSGVALPKKSPAPPIHKKTGPKKLETPKLVAKPKAITSKAGLKNKLIAPLPPKQKPVLTATETSHKANVIPATPNSPVEPKVDRLRAEKYFQKMGELRQIPGNVPPNYPRRARKEGLEGVVSLSLFVTRLGKVSDIKTHRSSGYLILDQEALRAISKYKFYPGQEGYTLHDVNFSLKGAPETEIHWRR